MAMSIQYYSGKRATKWYLRKTKVFSEREFVGI